MSNKYLRVVKQIGLLFVLYAFTRLLFLFFNYSYFKGNGYLFLSFFYGLRFDAVVISTLNSVLFLVYLLPFKYTVKPLFLRIYNLLFVLVNAIALLFNCIDIAYFEFTQKRSTFDLFQTLTGANDGMQVLPSYISHYWYILIIWLTIVFILIYTVKQKTSPYLPISVKEKVLHLLVIVFVFTPLALISSRGGIQYRPITMISAATYNHGKNVSLILNTPFSILRTFNKPVLSPVKYFDSDKLVTIYNPYQQCPEQPYTFNQKNVVIIIMESIGSEYTALAQDGKSLTPFLDSLSNYSTVYNQAYANGKTSIKGIPAVVAGIPTLFDGSFINSPYNTNRIESIATLLKAKNYSSSFYHGGINGTMGFDVFAKAAGFEKYYGRNEYPNKNDFDGNWGIFDEPFFQYFKNNLDKENTPFISCIFSLSSHHPYTLPDKYKHKFTRNELEISATIQYADYALLKFFETAQQSSWFKNTLFVITSDHTSMSINPKYQTAAGIYSIPLIVFDPSKPNGKTINKITQQIDILPLILHHLNYDLPYFSFGTKPCNNHAEEHFSVSYNGHFYQLITEKFCVQFDGENTIAVFDMKNDRLLSNNIVNQSGVDYRHEETLLKAIIQSYNNSLIENKMIIPPK